MDYVTTSILIAVMTSINLETTLNNVRVMMHNELEREKSNDYVGGNSTVLLFLLQGQVQTNQQTIEQAQILNDTVPGKIICLSRCHKYYILDT